MVWLFERDGESLRLEARRDSETGELLIVRRRADLSQEVERFRDVAKFQDRMYALEQELKADRWTGVGQPIHLGAWKLT